MTRSKHTKQRARRARQTSRAAPPTPDPAATTTPPPDAVTPARAPDPTAPASPTPDASTTAPASSTPEASTAAPKSPGAAAQAPHSERKTTDLVLADLAAHAVPASLPTLLHARCVWADALPPAAARQFADQARVALREATPETLREDLSEVLTRWHGTARIFGSA